MLVQRRGRWANIRPGLVQRLVLAETQLRNTTNLQSLNNIILKAPIIHFIIFLIFFAQVGKIQIVLHFCSSFAPNLYFFAPMPCN